MGIQLLVQVPVSESTDFDSLIAIENGLGEILAKQGGVRVHGHDFGQGKFNIRIVSEEPWQSIVGAIRAFLEFRGVADGVIATRADDAEDYRVLWPTGHTDRRTP
jgi:hypothetical protein